MNKIKGQILKNQASIMMSIVGILAHLKVDDLEYAIAIRDRMKETKDLFVKGEQDE